MTQVSRFPLPRALEERMFLLFRKVLAGTRNEQDVADLLDDLLSPTEKVMLGKRLAIAFLLDRGYNQREIHMILKVSTTTVNAVNYWFKEKGQGYRKAIRKIRAEQQSKQFISELEETLKEMFSTKTSYRRAYGGMSSKEDDSSITL